MLLNYEKSLSSARIAKPPVFLFLVDSSPLEPLNSTFLIPFLFFIDSIVSKIVPRLGCFIQNDSNGIGFDLRSVH